MKTWTIKTAGAAVVLLLVTVLPIAASTAFGRAVAPGEELAAFFRDRGADPTYLAKPRSEVPAEQWARIVRIVNTPDWDDPETEEIEYADDHDVLNSLVYLTLSRATSTVDDRVHLTLGRTTWTYERVVPDEE